MFKELLSFWSKEDLLRQAFDETARMLELAHDFFVKATAPLFTGERTDKDVIYSTDRQINIYEIETRTKVLEHLSISRKEDTTAALVLITIAIDIERLGDYSKNFYELWEMYGGRLGYHPAIERLQEVEKNIESMFDNTLESFKKADSNLAMDVMKLHIENTEVCESIIIEVIGEEESTSSMTCNQKIIVALAARYLKRISAHLKNVASSVVNPFDRIGFKPSKSGAAIEFDGE